MFVLSVPLGPFETIEQVRRELTGPDPERVGVPAASIVAGLPAIRVSERARDESDTPYIRHRLCLFDGPGRDIHIVVTSASEDDGEQAATRLTAGCSATARWIDAVTPPAEASGL